MKRFIGYLIGLVLFYAPFALYQKFIFYLLGKKNYADIHDFCLRIPLEHIWLGRIFDQFTIETITMFLFISSAFLLGPFFCGRLCIAGALGEYLSHLIPHKFQINWTRYIDPVPVRYGIFIGFLLSPFIGGYLACAYCNYRLIEAGIFYVFMGERTVLSSSVLFTAVLWLGLFGLFTRGGRGFCNFICPVGAAQNLIHWLGSKFPFVLRLKINHSHCIQCGKCIDQCPMGALQVQKNMLHHHAHHCITCKQCIESCPVKAISYTTEKKSLKHQEVNLCNKK